MAKAKGTRTRKTTFTEGHAVRERVRQGGEERVTAHAELPLAAGRPLPGRNFWVGEEHEVDDPGGRNTHIAGLGRVLRSVLDGEGKACIRGPVAVSLLLKGTEPMVEAGQRLGEEGCQARGTRLRSRSIGQDGEASSDTGLRREGCFLGVAKDGRGAPPADELDEVDVHTRAGKGLRPCNPEGVTAETLAFAAEGVQSREGLSDGGDGGANGRNGCGLRKHAAPGRGEEWHVVLVAKVLRKEGTEPVEVEDEEVVRAHGGHVRGGRAEAAMGARRTVGADVGLADRKAPGDLEAVRRHANV